MSKTTCWWIELWLLYPQFQLRSTSRFITMLSCLTLGPINPQMSWPPLSAHVGKIKSTVWTAWIQVDLQFAREVPSSCALAAVRVVPAARWYKRKHEQHGDPEISCQKPRGCVNMKSILKSTFACMLLILCECVHDCMCVRMLFARCCTGWLRDAESGNTPILSNGGVSFYQTFPACCLRSSHRQHFLMYIAWCFSWTAPYRSATWVREH